jgi:hypothetical protein
MIGCAGLTAIGKMSDATRCNLADGLVGATVRPLLDRLRHG